MKKSIVPFLVLISSILYYVTNHIMTNPFNDSWYMIYYGAISFGIVIAISYVAIKVLFFIFFILMIQRYKKEFFVFRDIIYYLMPLILLVQIIYLKKEIDISSLSIFKDYLMFIVINAIFSIIFLIGIYYICLRLGFEKEYYYDHFSSTRRGMSLIFPFSMGILFLFIIAVFFWESLFTQFNVVIIFCIILLYMWIKILYYLSNKYFISINKKDKEIPYIDFFVSGIVILKICGIVFLLCVFSWQGLFTSFTSSYLQGSISIDMKDRYLMNDSQIAATIEMTGPDTGILVTLKSESDNRDYDASIYLDKNNERLINKSIDGKLLGEGIYSVFVNTTGMTKGNYVLSCTRQKYGSFKSKRFEIANN